jgi:NAD(P)-dependent dehydrogenase (short-subunit alcohol dehydrogenase family)
MDLELTNKAALVTGGSKGIGAAIVQRLLAEGAHVANVNRSTAEGEALQRKYAAQGKECYFIQGDLGESDACRNAVEKTVERFGRIDIVINNAGVNDGVGLEDGPEQFLESLQRNLVHYYAIVHHALPYLKEARGAIVNIGSKVSVTGQGHTSGYAASKGGINGLTREWAVDLADDGIRVNAVLPAETWTPLYDRIIGATDDPAAEKIAIERLIPLGRRFTTCEEIADMAVFLVSARSLHTTGQVIHVDGGYTHLDRKCTS